MRPFRPTVYSRQLSFIETRKSPRWPIHKPFKHSSHMLKPYRLQFVYCKPERPSLFPPLSVPSPLK